MEPSRSLALTSWRSVAAGAGASSRGSSEEAWDRARKKAQARQAAQGGSSPPGAIPVGNFAALGVGLLGAAWYAGYFETELPKPDRMVAWLEDRKITVVVFELDYTMSAASSGDGLPKHELEDFMAQVSEDFVVAVNKLAKQGYKLAVATRGDPAQYERGRSRDKYLVGPDLARMVIQRRCPDALPSFSIIFGYDPELHRGVSAPSEDRGSRWRSRKAAAAPAPLAPVPTAELGKRHHMRKIAEHYQVEPKQLVLFDASQEMLENEDGWTGVLVTDRRLGFQFDDCLNA